MDEINRRLEILNMVTTGDKVYDEITRRLPQNIPTHEIPWIRSLAESIAVSRQASTHCLYLIVHLEKTIGRILTLMERVMGNQLDEKSNDTNYDRVMEDIRHDEVESK
jgi:hypothetical protein